MLDVRAEVVADALASGPAEHAAAAPGDGEIDLADVAKPAGVRSRLTKPRRHGDDVVLPSQQ